MSDPASERLLETMLSEALGQAAPPDFSAQVLAILEAEQTPVVGLPQIDTTTCAKRRSDAWLPLTLAAALLIAVSGYLWERHHHQQLHEQTQTVAEHNSTVPSEPVPTNAVPASGAEPTLAKTVNSADPHSVVTAPTGSAKPATIAERTPPRGNFEIGLQDLPFGKPTVGMPTEPQPTELASRPKIKRLPPEQIIQQVDDLLQQAWERMGIEPQNEIAAEGLVERLATVVAGRPQAEARDAEAVRQLLAGETDALIDRYIEDPQTANYLGTRWAKHLLGEPAWKRLSPAQQTEAGKLFASTFRGERAYNALVQTMLTSEGSSSPEDPEFEPATLWMAGLAGARAIPLTDQFCDVLLDLDVACGRCHSHPLENHITQRSYWDLNAIFQTGVQWQLGQQGGLQVAQDLQRDRSKDAVFYEASDGRQLVASPAVLGNWIGSTTTSNSPTNLRELAANIEHSDQLARATVNGLWKVIYGNRIVGRTSDPLAPPADEAFVSARNLLAEQLQAYDYDLGAAVAWIIAARPMRLQRTLSLFDQDSLVATEDHLIRAEIQERAFAGFANESRNWSFEELVAATESFNRASGKGALIAPSGLLAQAVDSDPTAKPKQKPKAQLRLESLRRAFPSAAASRTLPAGWLASLSNSGGFEQQVKHLYYVAGNAQTSERQLEAAMRIRRMTDSDSAALSQLWWAIRLSDSGT